MHLYQLLFPNGKKYIGITSKTAEDRFKAHCRSRKKYAIDSAIKKYGKENVILTVLAECDNWELLCLLEQEAIEKFDTKYPNGYNLTDGGEGTIGVLVSENTRKIMSLQRKGRLLSGETKDKISKSSKRNGISNETRLKMVLSRKGFKPSIETRKIWSLQRKGRIASDETRAKLSQALKGRTVSDEWRKKLSESNKGKKRSEETKRKNSDARKGFKHSEESLAKMRINSDKRKGIPRTQEVKDKLSIANKGKRRTEETKAKMSVAKKEYFKNLDINPGSKTYLVIHPCGKKEIITGLNKFCMDNNLSAPNMSDTAKGRYKQHKGFKCYHYSQEPTGYDIKDSNTGSPV